MSEYERIKQMHRHEYLMRNNRVKYQSTYQKARLLLKASMEALPDSESKLRAALKIAISALTKQQSEFDNPPLKAVMLEKMNNEPVWYVGYMQDGCWGIVNTATYCIRIPTDDGFDEHHWDDGYEFRYKKEIIDHTEKLKELGIEDEEPW